MIPVRLFALLWNYGSTAHTKPWKPPEAQCINRKQNFMRQTRLTLMENGCTIFVGHLTSKILKISSSLKLWILVSLRSSSSSSVSLHCLLYHKLIISYHSTIHFLYCNINLFFSSKSNKSEIISTCNNQEFKYGESGSGVFCSRDKEQQWSAGMGKLVSMRVQGWRTRDGRVGKWSKDEE